MSIIPTSIIIQRRELDNFLNTAKWGILYGRRKTGKTFYVLNRGQYEHHFIATTSGSIYDVKTGRTYRKETFLEILPHVVDKGIVIDEFHRIGEPLYSVLQGLSGKGKLLLITSAYLLFKTMLAENSPLLGLFATKKVSLASPTDLLRFWLQKLSEKEATEKSIITQEIWLANVPEESWMETALLNAQSIVHETLIEAERADAERYLAILSAVADGARTSGEIASKLYSHGLIPKDSPGMITKYLQFLLRADLLKRVRVHGKKRYRYRHFSPILDFVYYLDAKYGAFDSPVSKRVVERAWEQRKGIYAEWFFERLLAENYGLEPVKVFEPEVDIALAEFDKIKVVAEVKWQGRVTKADVRKAEKKLEQFEGAEKLLIVPSKERIASTELKVVTPKELASAH
jgi:hypothetical protein